VALASGGNAPAAARTALASGLALSSPNSGYPIAAFAGALGVSLCGPASYFGEIHEKPFIGDGPRPGTLDLARALPLYWNSYALAAALSLLVAWGASSLWL
jgi:adenosylcobinamide-phosphate synthase